MIDHTGIRVADIERSKRFFTEALAPLGYRVLREHAISGIGFGKERPDFWIKQGALGPRVHIAFAAEEREIVDAFYQAALAAGGRTRSRATIDASERCRGRESHGAALRRRRL